jgi:hypothetical protein
MSAPNLNTHFQVKNINGTSDPRYANSQSKTEDSWLAVWRSETGSQRTTCAALNCSREDLVGGHVINCDGRSSNEWMLAPICKAHNHPSNKDPFFLDSRVTLVYLRL